MRPITPSVLCVIRLLMISCTLSLNALVLLIVRRNCVCRCPLDIGGKLVKDQHSICDLLLRVRYVSSDF